MIRKQRETENKFLLEDAFVETENKQAFRDRILGSFISKHKKYETPVDRSTAKGDLEDLGTEKNVRFLDPVSLDSCNDTIGLVTSSEKSDTKDRTCSSLPGAFKRLSLNSSCNRTADSQCMDVVRDFETQLFVDENNPYDSSGKTKKKMKGGYFWSRKMSRRMAEHDFAEALQDDTLGDLEAEDHLECSGYKKFSRKKKNKISSVKTKSFKKKCKKVGVKAWKKLRMGLELIQGSLKSLSGPMVAFDLSNEVVGCWKLHEESKRRKLL